MIHFAWLTIFLLIFLLMVGSLTIFASVITANQIIAAALAFFIEIVLVSILGNISSIAKYLPGYTLSHYKELMDTGKLVDFLPSILVAIILMILFIFSSIALFQKQEIER